ncbi:MAG: hypothetical protein IKX76_04955 [Eubacterium sp.]|nr:hypothetical protein [Eubacterium sp.]
MKNVIKDVLIHAIVGVAVFMGAFFFFNHQIASEKGQDYSELSNSTFPVMQVRSENGYYNTMLAYLDPIDLSLVRNQITVLGNDRTLDLCLHHYNYDITAIQYELFTGSGEEALEEGTINQLDEQEGEGTRTGTIVFETNLKKDTNYYLKMAVRLTNQSRVFFYTKLVNGEGCHFNETMAFAREFHDNLFDKSEFQKNIKYLEPAAGRRTLSLENVDIHSSVDAVSFGSTKVKQESEPMVTVKEINDVYVVLQMDCILSSEVREGVVQYYDLSENYKLRYTSDRIYLLKYNRSMNSYYNKALNNPSKNYITLGIHDPEEMNYQSSDDGYKVCFVQEGQLWYYNYHTSDMARLYSFSSENLADLRNNKDSHNIKIMKMDDEGNIVYIVYGYMNRGHYEGKNGIHLLRYNAQNKCNEELIFLSTSVPYERMKKDIDRLCFLNQENIFYCILDGDLHAVDLEKKKDEILESGMINESVTASRDQSIIAIEDQRNLTKNTSIRMMDLETGQKHTFTCSDSQRIRAVGFLANDFIYGTASAQDVKISAGNVLTFPMKKLSIVTIEGVEIKSYKKSKRYILDTEMDGSVLEMKFGRKKGSKIVPVSDTDYIRYKEEEDSGNVNLVYDYSNTYWNQLSISFPNYVYIQVEPDLVLTKVLSSDKDMVVALERSRESKTQYYVYAEGEEQGVFDNLTEAILCADEKRGSVISSQEQTMWECGFADYAIVAGMDQVTKVKNDSRSLAGCLEMIAKVNGRQAKASQIETEGKKTVKLVKEYSGAKAYDISGCTVDEVLYYISKGYPVLTKYSPNRYVILMSYNSTKLRYLDPVTGQSTATDRKALTAKIENAGSRFYTYLK